MPQGDERVRSCYQRMGKCTKIRHEPDKRHNQNRRFLCEMNDLENAEINYKKTFAIGYDKYAYLGMVRIHLKRNHVDKAFETLAMLMKNEPHDPRISSEYNVFVEKYPHVKNIENKKAEHAFTLH